MKRFILIFGTLTLFSVLGLRAFFTFVPPEDPTLTEYIADIVPAELPGWRVVDKDMAESEEASARVSEFLNFDDALFRTFNRGNTFVGLYIAYWGPGKASYRWAGAHTPDTCWVVNGWSCNERKYSVPFNHNETEFEPAEFGIYEKDGYAQKVYFWHLVGGEAQTYKQSSIPNIFGALIDIRDHGLNLRDEQFFIRLSSNRSLEELKQMPGFDEILDALEKITLTSKAGSAST